MGISDIIQDVGRSLSKGINNLFNIPSEVNVAYPVHAEIIRRDDQIKNLVRKLRTVEGQFAREQADRIQREEEEKKRDFQEELKEELHKQKQGIEKQKYQKTFSWGKLFLKMFTDKRYKGQIEIQDKDGEVTFGFLEDYLFTDDGLMALTLKGGEIISIGRTPNELIYKPQSLVNQLRKKIIQIPVDKNRRYVPDIEQMETYDVIRDEDGNYKQATEKLYLVKEKLIEYNEIIEDKSERIQNLETQTEEMKSTISDLKMANVATSKSSEMAETRLSQALQKMMAMQTNYGGLQNRNTSLQEQVGYYEKAYNSVEEQRDELQKKLKYLGIEEDFKKLMAHFKNNLEFIKDLQGEENKSKSETPKPVRAVESPMKR